MATNDKNSDTYPVPLPSMSDPWRTELTIRRSLFVCRAFRCESGAEVKDFISFLREKEPDATHHCWAYAAGAPGQTAKIGCSDDGEPHGTAGKPMLNILLHSGIGQICAVTSRWFGGIKLGTGGLVRAYQESVQENLKNLPVLELVPSENWTVYAEYVWLDAIKRCLSEFNASIIGECYTDRVELRINLPSRMTDDFQNRLARLSNGAIGMRKAEQIYA